VATTGEAMPEVRRKIYVKSKEKSLCVASATLLVHGLRFVESEEETVCRVWLLEGERGAGLGSLVIAPECYKAEAHLQQCSSAAAPTARTGPLQAGICSSIPLLHITFASSSSHPISSHHLIPHLPPNAGGLMTIMPSEFVFQCRSPDDRSLNH
jgi:hypothetical protein